MTSTAARQRVDSPPLNSPTPRLESQHAVRNQSSPVPAVHRRWHARGGRNQRHTACRTFGNIASRPIGCGGRGKHDAELLARNPDVEIAYVCDPDEGRRAQAAKQFSVSDSRAIGDMRQLLEDETIGAVIVGTPDHWHAPAAILACNAGKHVYVEKPISHNIREGRLLVEAAQRNGVQVQHGTQCRSTGMMIEAVRRLREGIIGDVLVAKCWNVQRRGTIGRGEDTDPPAGFDYDVWVGPATMVPYRTNRVHNRWTWWRHFGTGDMGNDGVHDIDYTRWGLGVDVHPTKIHGPGGKFFFDDDQQFPDTQQVTFEYPGDDRRQPEAAHLRAAALEPQLSAQHRQRRGVLRHARADVPQPPREDPGAQRRKQTAGGRLPVTGAG